MWSRSWVAAAILWLLLIDLVTSAETGSNVVDKMRLISITVAVLMHTVPEDFGDRKRKKPSFRQQSPCRNRKRRFVHDTHEELGPCYTRRAHRMTGDSFWELHRLLSPRLNPPKKAKKTKRKSNGAKNGTTSSATRLSCALRYFAGGRPEDICLVHGTSHSEVFNSAWKVVDAVNMCPSLSFSFPESHAEQQRLAAGFQTLSKPKFDCCIGCVDGMLLWLERPTEIECEKAKCGAKKFLCGRKSKFGLNFQGTCDAECGFLDVSMRHPGSTSDFLAFSASSLYYKLETPNFLAPGLCLFGDAACVNCRYFATPYKAVSSGTKFDYNYHHSSVS